MTETHLLSLVGFILALAEVSEIYASGVSTFLVATEIMLADSALIIAVINTLYYVPLQQVNYVVKARGASVLISHYHT